ncbi:MAG: hypothetical protein FJW64_09755 [Actinobacteria bacterium]|nr:hypothetical protein [Actinomycetota bacterium]
MSRRYTLLGLLGAGLLAAGALTGCASGAATSPETPDAASSAPASDITAGWLDGGRMVALVTYGSSSCVPTAASEPTLEGRVLTVTLADNADTACTRDMAPRATAVMLPAGVDPTQGLEIAVEGAVTGQAILAGLPAAPETVAEFAPSAGWVDSTHVAVLTWGSSSCRPAVETVAAEGESIALTFAAPPADQVCTMDIAPRVTLAEVGGVAGAGEVSLTLSGGNVAADGPVPVLGVR